MDKKLFYETPYLKEVEFNQEGVLCTSERGGSIDDLNPKYDWSDMWNN